ncbi:MAG: hypothetical protein JOZ53_19385, partial [Planctomycetaceae bacterium]|nr:hypothetical protein [Planctomycetaceae bacterium]
MRIRWLHPIASSWPTPCARSSPAVLSHLPLSGHTDWTPRRLAWVATRMAWDEGQTLGTRGEHARDFAHGLHPHGTPGTSSCGFTAAWMRSSPALTEALKPRFRRQNAALRRGLLASRPRARFRRRRHPHRGPPHRRDEADLGCAGRDQTAPQVSLTTVWPMGTGWPGDDHAGPGTGSERTHLKQMVPDLPPGALVVADAGSVGSGLCLRFWRHGQHSLWRVGNHIKLLKDLGSYREERDGPVDLWPHNPRRCRPLVLRLIVLRHGTQDMSLLTDVLDPAQLADADAATVFGMRWGEGVFSRSDTQALRRRELLSRTAATGLAEVQWTLLGLWLLGLMTASRWVGAGVDPPAFSVARRRAAVRPATR